MPDVYPPRPYPLLWGKEDTGMFSFINISYVIKYPALETIYNVWFTVS